MIKHTNLPTSWDVTPLSALIEFALGGDWGKSPEHSEDGFAHVYCIRGSEFKDWQADRGNTASLRKVKRASLKKRRLREGDILVEISGGGPEQPVGRTVLIDQQCLTYKSEIPKVATNFLRLIRISEPFNQEYLNRYLEYFYKSGEVRNYQGGSNNLRNLKFNNYIEIDIPVAPLNEQKRIVAKIEELFTELDKGVESLKKAREQLKVYRQALLKQAFEGKLTEQWRKDNPDKLEPAEKLLERIKQEREAQYQKQLDEWKASVEQWEATDKEGKRPTKPRRLKLPEPVEEQELSQQPILPDSWIWVKLGTLTWSVKDGPHYSPKYSDSGIPFISGGNIRPTGVDFENVKYITEQLHSELCKRCKPELGDILYTKGGTTGIARVNTYERDFNVWVHVAVLKLVESVDAFYLQHVLNSPFPYSQSQKFTHGVGNQDLGLTRMVNIIVPFCSEEEQNQLVQEIEKSISALDRHENEVGVALKRSEALRQSILKKAFSGELVSQDHCDEPASVLLERIIKEKKETTKKVSKKKTMRKAR